VRLKIFIETLLASLSIILICHWKYSFNLFWLIYFFLFVVHANQTGDDDHTQTFTYFEIRHLLVDQAIFLAISCHTATTFEAAQ